MADSGGVAGAADAAEIEFLSALGRLLDRGPGQPADAHRAAMLRRAADMLERGTPIPRCDIVPFLPGHPATHEAFFPGLGSSQQSALVLPGDGSTNVAYLLYTVATGDDAGRWEVDATLSFTGHDGTLAPAPIPGWDRRPIEPQVLERVAGGGVRLCPAGDLTLAAGRRLALAIHPNSDLLPGGGWSWEDLDDRIRATATRGQDPYTFGQLFSQQLSVVLRLTHDGVPVAGSTTSVHVSDNRRSGSLYLRLIDGLVAPDTARQARRAGVDDPGEEHHPWFPVLHIGSDKAALYTRAVVDDLVNQGRQLSDPGWLVKVGIYLELLTFLGICEAVREDVGDLLHPDERQAFEHGAQFDEIRRRIDPEAWAEVWALRHIAFPRRGTPRLGQVSALNLLAKKKATMRFLHVHHEDLKHAVELAGPNHHNSQETWHRVFRDAERAVLRQSDVAFPELRSLNGAARNFALWHRQGEFDLGLTLRVPAAVSGIFADQDGVYASACTQYRASMNHVAEWAQQRGLMDHTGVECIPPQASLLESFAIDPNRVVGLQHRDGFDDGLGLVDLPPRPEPRTVPEVASLLSAVPIFGLLQEQEVTDLAATARPVALGPTERLLVQGDAGSSLFVMADGEVEVLVRGEDQVDVVVNTLGPGAVIGEMSLLTGEPRRATVRAVDGALLYEIGAQQYGAHLRAHREWVDQLAHMMQARLATSQAAMDRTDGTAPVALATRIMRRFFG